MSFNDEFGTETITVRVPADSELDAENIDVGVVKEGAEASKESKDPDWWIFVVLCTIILFVRWCGAGNVSMPKRAESKAKCSNDSNS